MTGEEGRSHKQGGIGRFFGFLCCRGASPKDDMNSGSRKAHQRPGSKSSRRSVPVGKINPKDINVSDSRGAVETEKTVEDAGESKLKSENPSVPPVILNSESGQKDDDKIKTADGEGLVGEKILVKDSSTVEDTSAKRLSLLDTTPIVTVQAPTPTVPTNESDDNSSRPGSASLPELATEPVIKKEDVDMKDVNADNSSDDGRVDIALPLPSGEEAQPDSDSDDGSETGPGITHDGDLVQTPPGEDRQQWLLPPIAPRFEGKKCLVLDLDETLVHSSFKVYYP